MTDMEIQRDLIYNMCNKSTHVCILGKREEGKTCLGYSILNWHRQIGDKECIAYNHPQPNMLPKWIKNITDLRYLTGNQVVLVDESSNDFDKFSYAKQSNRYLMEKMKKARQTNTSFIFVDHSSDFLNKNMLKLIDIWMLKNNTEYAIEDERKFLKKLYSRMERAPKLNEFWFHTDGYEGIISFEKPPWFTKDLSHAYDVHSMDVTPMSDLIVGIKEKYGPEMANRVEEEVKKRVTKQLADDIVPDEQKLEKKRASQIKQVTDIVKAVGKQLRK